MKNYYVKLGNMYLKEIYTNNELYENNFVLDLDFCYYKTFALTINKDDQYYIIKILEYVFGMDSLLTDFIKFEEVKEDGE